MRNFFRRMMRHYTYDLKLKNKLVISHALLILLPTAVLSGFIFVKLYGIVMDDSIRSEQALSAQTAASIENLVSHVTYVSDALKESSSIHRLFYLSESDAAAFEPEQNRMDSLFLLTDSLTDNTMITGIRIYYDDSVYPDLMKYNTEGNRLFAPVSSVSSSYWYGIFSTMHDRELLCPELYLSPSEAGEFGRLAYISKITYLPPVGSDQELVQASAYLAVYFNGEPFDSALINNASVKGEAAYIINSRDVMVSASDMALAGIYYIPADEFFSEIGPEKTFSLVAYPDGDAYTAYFPVRNTDWYMVSLLPSSHITDAGRNLMVQLIMAYLLFTAAALFIALKLSVSIADRIIAVAYQMESVRTGRPRPMEAEETGCDEIGVLTDTYNYMTEEINDLMNSQEKASEDLRLAEFRALQAQINPHFLYNTLDMINWLSRTGRKEDVTKAVQTLSRFYKLTLSKRGLMNTIEEELEHTELYVELQNMRYDDCVSFVVDVPDELSEYTIPKLTFQPIVENAWLHGIMDKEEKSGNILLTGWRQGGDIVFLISDDGIGIPPEKLESILAEGNGDPMANGTSDSVHIGVYNTNLRLKRLYGDSYGLTFQSSPGMGTEVTIKIPAKRREDSPV